MNANAIESNWIIRLTNQVATPYGALLGGSNMVTLLELARLDEAKARQMMEGIRWPNGPECPHCTSNNAVRLQGKATRSGVLKCRDCAKQFTVTVNSLMHQSRIPLSKMADRFSPDTVQ